MSEKVFGPYHDGYSEVHGDPFKIFLSLVRLLDGDPEAVNRQAQEPPPPDGYAEDGTPTPPPASDVAAWRLSTAEAQQRLADAAREAFEMVAFDKVTGTGATDEDCRRVLDEFLTWMGSLKKSTASRPTSPPPTAPSPFSVPGLSPGTSDSDCGCS